jgi:formamidopyrimidine-DNA glycosylase
MWKLTALRDEILYHAKIHPEQYSNTLDDDQVKHLHSAIDYICSTSVDLLGDSEKFPEDWLFKHRWGKGKKNQPSVLPNGEKIEFVTVGGRTSAVVPSMQRKSGPVASESSDAKSNSKRKRTVKKQEDDSDVDDESQPKKTGPKKQSNQNKATKPEEEDNTASGKRRSTRLKK